MLDQELQKDLIQPYTKKEIEGNVEQKIIEEPEKARNSKQNFSQKYLNKLKQLEQPFKDIKGNLLDPGTTRLNKSNIKAIA